MAKEIKLTISERLEALKIFNNFKGKLEQLKPILDDIGQFSVTDTEWEKANRVITPAANGETTWNWDDEKGGLKKINLSDDNTVYLKGEIGSMSEKGELTIANKATVSLYEKLKA